MRKIAVLLAAVLLTSCSGGAVGLFPSAVDFSWPSGQSVALEVSDNALFSPWNAPSWTDGTASGFIMNAPTTSGALRMANGSWSVTVYTSSSPLAVVTGSASSASTTLTSSYSIPAGDSVICSAFPAGTTVVSTTGSSPTYSMTLSNPSTLTGAVTLVIYSAIGSPLTPSFTVSSDQNQSYVITQ